MVMVSSAHQQAARASSVDSLLALLSRPEAIKEQLVQLSAAEASANEALRASEAAFEELKTERAAFAKERQEFITQQRNILAANEATAQRIAADQSKVDADKKAFQEQQIDTERRIKAREAACQHIEAMAKAVTEDVAELGDRQMAFQKRVDEFEVQRTAHEARVERIQAAIAS